MPPARAIIHLGVDVHKDPIIIAMLPALASYMLQRALPEWGLLVCDDPPVTRVRP